MYLFQSLLKFNANIYVITPVYSPVLSSRQVDGHLMNTGNDITFVLNQPEDAPFLITGGPLSYNYNVHMIKLHFGRIDQIGSEHTVGGRPFPLEVRRKN